MSEINEPLKLTDTLLESDGAWSDALDSLSWKNRALQNALVAVDEKWRAADARWRIAQARIDELERWDAAHVTVVRELNAQSAMLREALEREQWDDVVEDRGYRAHWCRRCTGSKAVEHDKDCPIGLALASDAGAKMLTEVRRLREFVAGVRLTMSRHEGLWYSQTRGVLDALAALDAGEVTG